MLEIVALFFLTRHVGRMATRKALKPGTWKVYLILAWIAGELAGLVLALALFGKNNLFGILLTGLCGAFGGYLVIKATLDKIPDVVDEDMNRIGVDDLRPPRKN